MKNIRLVLILIFLNISLLANINFKSPNTFIKDESFIFEYEVSGSSIKFPDIKIIDGFLVESLGTSRSMQFINGNYSEKISKKFKIVPNKEFVIPSFIFIIDNKEIKTKEKKITEKKVSQTKSDNFELTLIPSKTSLYVGEDLLVKLIFKYKKDLQIQGLSFEQPHFANFWYKKVANKNNNKYEENGFIVQELDFLLFPQKSGKLKISPLRVDVQIQTNDSNTFGFFNTPSKLLKVYSNELNFNIKELPNNLTLYGDFNIDATIDKNKINQGEAVSYNLNIYGTGNFDDLDDIELNIPNATIYKNKPSISTEYTKNGLEGIYTKTYSLLASSSFEIPSITLKYFSKKEQRIIEKRTKAFKVEVENQTLKEIILEKPKKDNFFKKEIIIEKEQSSLTEKIVYFFFGIFITLLIIGLIFYDKLRRLKNKKNELPLIKLVKSTKDKKSLIKVLVPYLKIDPNLDKLIFQCESDDDFKILKKQIIELLKQIKI